jgi:hypothetical protein
MWAKGLVERFHDYPATSFLRGRSFSCPVDLNGQLQEWLQRVNARQHGVLGCRPIDRLDADRAAMLTLPSMAPVVG